MTDNLMNIFDKEARDEKFAELYAIMLSKNLLSIFDVPEDLRVRVAVHMSIMKSNETIVKTFEIGIDK